MDKIKTIKIKDEDGSISEESYTIAADAINVDMSNGYNLQDTIGTININIDGNISKQLNNKININDIVDNLNSNENKKVLSAKQGKELKSDLDEIYNKFNNNEKILTVNYLSIKDASVTQEDSRHLGDCIVILGEKNIIIDLGFQNDCAKLIDFLNNNNVSKIDSIIISHFHGDHIGGFNAEGFESLLNSNIDFSECIVYLPHKGINWNSFIGTKFNTKEAHIIDLLSSKNIKYYYPNNKESIALTKNLKLTFYNIGSDFYNDYYSCLDNWNLTTSESTNYNNFSMVVLLEHFKNKFLFTADIEPLAQSKLYKYIKDIDVLKIEHHGLNYITNKNYLNQLNPKYAVVCELDDLTGYDLLHNTLYNLKIKGCSIYRTTLSGDITITSTFNKIEGEAEEKIEVKDVTYNLYEGEPILANSDLNNYLIPGTYNSRTQGNTATLLHCPITGAGFKLIVERHTQSTETIRQTLLKNNVDGAIYVRNIIGGVYGNWNRLSNGIDFDLDSSSFTPGSFDITYTTTNKETRYQCKNNICNLNLSFKANEDIATGQTILTLPTEITINEELRTIVYPNQITDFYMTASSGNVYPMYLGGGNQLRTRLQIPNGTTVRGSVTFILS